MMGLFSSKVKSLSYWIMWFWQCVCVWAHEYADECHWNVWSPKWVFL